MSHAECVDTGVPAVSQNPGTATNGCPCCHHIIHQYYPATKLRLRSQSRFQGEGCAYILKASFPSKQGLRSRPPDTVKEPGQHRKFQPAANLTANFLGLVVSARAETPFVQGHRNQHRIFPEISPILEGNPLPEILQQIETVPVFDLPNNLRRKAFHK